MTATFTADSPNLFPQMLTMFLWIIAMFARGGFLRVKSVKSGALPMRYFEVFQGATPPVEVVKSTNNMNNLMQLPHLFFVICLYITVTGRVDSAFHVLAWLFVAFRIAHSLVHITYNKVPHRFAFFIAGNIALIVMWIRTAFMVFR